LTSSNILLDVRNLQTYFRTALGTVRAVDGIDLQVLRGETVGLVGESGCGKTMTAHSIMRLVPSPPGFSTGQIFFQGHELISLPEHELRKIRGKKISMVFQDPMTYLNPVLKIGRQIEEVMSARRNPGEAVRLLESMGIAEPSKVVKQYPHELSGGMRQRVLMAIAMANDPVLIIADEPTTALDVTIQAQILELIKSIGKGKNTSVLMITHDLGIVAELCDRVYVMYAGRIVESGDVFSLFERPLHPYTQGLLKSALSIAEFKEALEPIEGSVPDLLNPPAGCRFHPRCPAVMNVCREAEPPVIEVSPGCQVRCWLWKV
jgi:oligopeptide/dipeptide ABC transporter ATP-binding protein